MAETRRWSDLWPTHAQERARVNMYLHFHHRTIREASVLFLAPLFNGSKNTTRDVAQHRRKMLESGLNALEHYYLSDTAPFLAGQRVTLAGAACGG